MLIEQNTQNKKIDLDLKVEHDNMVIDIDDI
jgi:hypothetical protein